MPMRCQMFHLSTRGQSISCRLVALLVIVLTPATLALGISTAAAATTGQDGEQEAGQQESKPPAGKQERDKVELIINERVMVIGDAAKTRDIPGSAHFLTRSQMERQNQAFDDIHRLLRQVPGVNIQEEDGFGLRPNIGLRGSGTERSSKITLMHVAGSIERVTKKTGGLSRTDEFRTPKIVPNKD